MRIIQCAQEKQARQSSRRAVFTMPQHAAHTTALHLQHRHKQYILHRQIAGQHGPYSAAACDTQIRQRGGGTSMRHTAPAAKLKMRPGHNQNIALKQRKGSRAVEHNGPC
eukprot:1161638-Pelagomonas_calceolata.AAC.4